MKKVYIDATTFMCHANPGEGRFEHEAEYLDDNETHVVRFGRTVDSAATDKIYCYQIYLTK